MSGHIPDEIVEKAGIAYLLHMPTGSAIEKEPLRAALTAVCPDLQRLQPGELHEIDKAFYDLTVKERDFERQRAGRLAAERDRAREQIERLENALDATRPDPDPPQCEAVCYAGPGHQSRFSCDLPVGHEDKHQYSEVRFEWTEDGECVD